VYHFSAKFQPQICMQISTCTVLWKFHNTMVNDFHSINNPLIPTTKHQPHS
jgi:hypothetical protein